FQAALSFVAGKSPLSVAVGDFNGDGKLDLAVTNRVYEGTVSVLLGNGDGTFQAALTSSTGGPEPFSGRYPLSVAAGDFNGDGKLDLAVAASPGISVLLGGGDGSFQAPRTFGVGGGPASVAVGDFNGDRTLDLVVANRYSNTVSVLVGNGDRTFPTAPTFAAGASPRSMVAGDFNGDGVQDLAVADA